jgi:NADH dehydrogenase FAD-containing subunit
MGHNTSKSASSKDKKVVIIGGSYAGRAAARLLEKESIVTCIERREVLVHKMLVRSAVCDEWIDPTLIPSSHMLSTGKIVYANVTGVNLEDRSLTCETSEGEQVINFDYLIIASGAQSRSPMEPPFTKLDEGSLSAMKNHFTHSVETIARHKDILIVGGGPVGCELAGEIKAKYPDSRVTIVSSVDRLCNKLRTTKEGSDKIQRALEKHGISVKLSVEIPVEVDKFKNGFMEFTDAQSFADGSISGITLMILAIGASPNTQFLPKD